MLQSSLPEGGDDLQMEVALSQVFGEFGSMYVKLRRRKGMPFAFIQYTNREDALNAKDHVIGTNILGRPCRIEMARGNCPWIVTRADNTWITVTEARNVVAPYGDIESIILIPDDLRGFLKLPYGVLVMYADFDPDRDLRDLLKRTRYRAFKYEPEKRARPAEVRDVNYLEERLIAQRSVFVKPIPYHITKAQLRDAFLPAGAVDVENIRIILDSKSHITVPVYRVQWLITFVLLQRVTRSLSSLSLTLRRSTWPSSNS